MSGGGGEPWRKSGDQSVISEVRQDEATEDGWPGGAAEPWRKSGDQPGWRLVRGRSCILESVS